MTNWFISVNGEQKGPYPTDQLRQLVSDGFVPRDAYVWREGMAQWLPLAQVRIADDGPAAPSPAAPVQSQQYAQQAFAQQPSYGQQQAYGQQQPAYAGGSYASYVKPGYFSFNGRIGRQTLWINYVVIPVVVITVLGIIGTVLSQSMMSIGEDGNVHVGPLVYVFGAIAAIAYIVLIVGGLSGQVKRLHDRGRSGWFVLLSLVPIANIWIMIETLFLKGTTGPNDYGPDPLG